MTHTKNPTDPVIDDLVCFLTDQTLCMVIGSIPSTPPIFGLEHPRLGPLLVRRHMFVFPIIGGIDIPTIPKRVLCRDCRWMKQIRHPAAGRGEEAPIVATCWNPTFIMDGERDYVLGEVMPADPYVRNQDGHCYGFEVPPNVDSNPDSKKEPSA